MCLANAYCVRDRDKELVFRDVAYMDLQNGKIRLVTLLGEEKTLEGRLLEVDFENSFITMEFRE